MPSAVTGSQLCHLKGGRCSPVWLLSQTSQLWAFPSVSPLAKCKQALCVSADNELRCLIELYGSTFVQILNHFADSPREPWVLEHMVKIHKCLLHDVKEQDCNKLEGDGCALTNRNVQIKGVGGESIELCWFKLDTPHQNDQPSVFEYNYKTMRNLHWRRGSLLAARRKLFSQLPSETVHSSTVAVHAVFRKQVVYQCTPGGFVLWSWPLSISHITAEAADYPHH